MAKVGRFDPGLGIQALSDGRAEIGRSNLPGAARLLPESGLDRDFALVYGHFSDSALLERFGPYLAMDLKHRELLSPDVFFETLARTAATLENDAGGGWDSGVDPLAAAARTLREVLADKALCEMLRTLVLRA